MLASFERLHCQIEVRENWRSNGDRIDCWIGQHVSNIRDGLDSWIMCLDLSTPSWALITHRYHPSTGGLCKVAHQIRSPVTVADNADSYHEDEPSFLLAMSLVTTWENGCR